MIEHVYRRAAAARGVDAVVVATDDERIATAVRGFGGIAAMTSAAHRTGTDRIAEVAAGLPCEIVLNVQGDEPLIEPETIEAVVAPLLSDPMLEMSTVCVAIANRSDYDNPNVVKVVKDRTGRALYFSRAPIPHFRGGPPEDGGPAQAGPYDLGVGAGDLDVKAGDLDVGAGFSRPFKHIGLYGYRRTFLMKFATPRSEERRVGKAGRHGRSPDEM